MNLKLEQNLKNFKLYLTDNMITINDVVDVINNNEVYDENFNYSKSLIQDQSEIRGVILRVDMLG